MSQILKSLCVFIRSLGTLPNLFVAFVRQIVRLLLRIGLLQIYAGYRAARRSLQAVWRPAKNRLLFPFATRYVAHTVLILITFFVATNSLSAREIRSDEQVKPSLLMALMNGNAQDDDEIVVTADDLFSRTRHQSYGIGGVSTTDMVDTADTASVVARDNSTLVNPSLATTDIGVSARTDIIHHTVAQGETLGEIAQAYQISTNTIRWANGISGDMIKPGQDLVIPPVTGVVYRVSSGDTLLAIAKKYQADADSIVDFNKLASAEAITEGQTLILPDGAVPPPVAPTPTPTSRVGRQYANVPGADVSNIPPPNASGTGGSGLLWPAISHRINQYFTWRHTGVDIDGDTGNPTYASAAGRIVAAGWGSGYGLRIIIDHGNGMQTLYGHSSKLYVKVGDYVNKGQTIAAIGCTGRCTGSHIHFEVRIGGRFQNPLSYTR